MTAGITLSDWTNNFFYMNPQTTVKVLKIFLSFMQPASSVVAILSGWWKAENVHQVLSLSWIMCTLSSSKYLSFSHSVVRVIKLGNFQVEEVYQISQISSFFQFIQLKLSIHLKNNTDCMEFASELCCSCLCYLIHNFIYSIFIHEIELLENIYDFFTCFRFLIYFICELISVFDI